MATAGRRRTLKRLEKLKNFAAGLDSNNGEQVKSEIRVGFKPIQIKHLRRKKRKESDLEAVAEEASLAALLFMDLFLNMSTFKKSMPLTCMERMFCCTSKAASSLGGLGQRLASLFSQTAIKMLHLNPLTAFDEASKLGSAMESCQMFACRSSKVKFCQ